MDFIRVGYKEDKEGNRVYYPSLQAMESQDLVIRGGQFMAIWDEDKGLYSRKLSHMPDIIDRSFAKMVGDRLRPNDTMKKVRNFDNQIYSRIMGLIRNIGDMGPDLDQHLVFADQTPTKEHAATFKMPYSLAGDPIPAWDEILSTLYTPEERLKIEWMIGSIFTGDSKSIQKFYVFFGPPGSGKSTIMNIIEMLFAGHTKAFSAFEMGRADAQFSLEPFARNPLVAIDQDADLSRLEVNKNLNSIVSHDRVLINAKGKSVYEVYPKSVLIAGTNSPVKITDRKSGLFRRLVDIQPTGNTIPETKYHELMARVRFELGSIATHCTNVFKMHGPTYLSSYRSNDMMYRTNDIFNFVQDNRLILAKGATVKQAFKLYNEWCQETDTRNIYKQYQFRDLLADYFKEFHEQIMVDGQRYRSYFCDLRELEHFTWKGAVPKPTTSWLELDATESLLDDILADMPAQLSTGNDLRPLMHSWDNVKTTLKELDTSKEHYVKIPTQHIVIDFDIVDENGEKSLEKNLEAAALWPQTYAEVSRSGKALHLHYDYVGDVATLKSDYAPGIEVKTLLGGSSLRRRFTIGNGLPVATLSSGLEHKEQKVISAKTMSSEKGLRELILRGLNKEIHQYTKPSMDFIQKVLQDAHDQGLEFNVSDMYDDILNFAMSSNNQRAACLEILASLKLKNVEELAAEPVGAEKPLAIFDIEVYPNLTVIGWKYYDKEGSVTKLVNPSPGQVEELLLNLRLIGFNNRMYDAHILWALTLGYSPMEVFELSQQIIVHKNRNAMFGAAYSLTYADIYEFAATKKSLKVWELDLGLPHMEMDLPWDQPVPEDRMEDVMKYLDNDVYSTEAVLKHLWNDFEARLMLAELSGLEPINTNKQHTEKLIFGELKDTKDDLVYTDLSVEFPGYKFDQFKAGKEKSTYRGENVGEGGYVYAEPGMYENVALIDVASMHPTSIVNLNLFGRFTKEFKKLLDIRLLIKNGRMEEAGLLDPRLKPYLSGDPDTLATALKLVINSVYGLTAASFDNKFRDPRNIDNIVAKRGALFMVDLKTACQQRGLTVVHIKTDSIKIANATKADIDFVYEFGLAYGYSFEHEATYDRFCLVNDAVYIARVGWAAKASKIGKWEAVGAQFQHPVVYKTMFSGEEVEPKDFVEKKSVTKGAMFLENAEGERTFVGRFGAYVPVTNGRTLLRVDGDKESAVTGTKGYLWEIDEIAMKDLDRIDTAYFDELLAAARRKIEEFGSYDALIG